MAVELERSIVEQERFIVDQLKLMPLSWSSSRGPLERALADIQSGDILSSSQLVEKEHEALRAFFGKEILVPVPPPELVGTQKVAESEGFGILVPLYFPVIRFKKDDEYPGWKIKPQEWYWNQIREGRISSDAAKLGGYWGLFDESRRPQIGKQMFPEDPLAPILSQARKEGRLMPFSDNSPYEGDVPEGSRYAVCPKVQDQVVFPQLEEILQLTEGIARVRRPTAMEFNFAGNFRYPHLGEVCTAEWLHDKVKGGSLLVGGDFVSGGLASVEWGWPTSSPVLLAFRPLVDFSPKLG